MPENDATAPPRNDVTPPRRDGGQKRLSGFGVRAISALVMAPVALLVFYAGGIWLAAAVVLVGALATYEWNRMTGETGNLPLAVNALTLAGSCAALMVAAPWIGLASLLAGALLAGLVSRLGWPGVLWSVVGLAYIGAAVLGLFWLRDAFGYRLVFWLFFLIWATDVGAYITGSLVGGPKLAPRFSPKKTWSGLLGGSVLAGTVSAIFGSWTGLGDVYWLIPVGMLLACWAQLGDMVESMVKRRFNVKDSGQIIPGHGGILDRIDSLIFTVPLIVLTVLTVWSPGAGVHG